MININDFKEKSIIYITSDIKIQTNLKIRNNNLCLYKDNKLTNKVLLNIILSIYIIGDCTITTKVIEALKSNGISIFFLNSSFKCIGYINSIAEGNTKLRYKQYLSVLDLEISKAIIKNKIDNQQNCIKKSNNIDNKVLYNKTIENINNCKDSKTLLGIEGNYSKYYFKNIFKNYNWYRRAPRTKEDINNLLLDIGYTYIFNFIDSLLLLFGFDTYKGVYHKVFFQRKSLSCDIVEVFRPIIDYQLIKAYNLKQINNKDFIFKNGMYSFKNFDIHRKYSKIFQEAIMKQKTNIYKYIYKYYRYIMDPENNKLPIYIFK